MKADAKTEAEVMSVLETWATAYAKRDVNAVMSLFATDSDMVFIGTGADERRLGPAEVKLQVERDFDQSESMTVDWKWRSISVYGDIAAMATECVVNAVVGGQQLTFPLRITGVLQKRNGRWLWVQWHSSAPDSSQETGSAFPAVTR